jgi:hypothetical protein
MSFLSQAPPLGYLPSPHGAFQEHAAHPSEWSEALSSKGSLGTCIPSGLLDIPTCRLHGARGRPPRAPLRRSPPPSCDACPASANVARRRAPPCCGPRGGRWGALPRGRRHKAVCMSYPLHPRYQHPRVSPSERSRRPGTGPRLAPCPRLCRRVAPLNPPRLSGPRRCPVERHRVGRPGHATPRPRAARRHAPYPVGQSGAQKPGATRPARRYRSECVALSWDRGRGAPKG